MPDKGLKEVQRCLAANPQAISQFFFDCDFEPVICFAVRSACAPKIVQFLLEHGAETDACDSAGHSPLTLLAASSPILMSGPENEADIVNRWEDQMLSAACIAAKQLQLQFRKEVCGLLIQASKESDRSLRSAVEVAKASGNTDLAGFMEHHLEIKSGLMLVRAQLCDSGPFPLGPLSEGEMHVVLEHLLPADLKDWVCSQDININRMQNYGS
jgi:ankyrin repeat protein